MERRLQLLDSFVAQATDGRSYKVRAYEHQVRDDAWLRDGQEHWESTGQTEYRLDDGERLEVLSDGSLRVPRSGVALRLH